MLSPIFWEIFCVCVWGDLGETIRMKCQGLFQLRFQLLQTNGYLFNRKYKWKLIKVILNAGCFNPLSTNLLTMQRTDNFEIHFAVLYICHIIFST